ncbi:MAG TPA: hypothetical protein EYH32_03730 [Anaerolineae bacterium]|nr:hypothetical protein [Anaerolineae bacterium]
MNKWSRTIAFIGLVVLLAGCSTSDAGPEQAGQATPVIVAGKQTPVNTLPPIATPTIVTPTTTPPPVTPLATTAAAPATGDVQRVTPAEAKTLLDSGAAVLYDVRSADAYRTQHAVGAISFPQDTVDARYSTLPTDKTLIFY